MDLKEVPGRSLAAVHIKAPISICWLLSGGVVACLKKRKHTIGYETTGRARPREWERQREPK